MTDKQQWPIVCGDQSPSRFTCPLFGLEPSFGKLGNNNRVVIANERLKPLRKTLRGHPFGITAKPLRIQMLAEASLESKRCLEYPTDLISGLDGPEERRGVNRFQVGIGKSATDSPRFPLAMVGEPRIVNPLSM